MDQILGDRTTFSCTLPYQSFFMTGSGFLGTEQKYPNS